MRRLVGWSLPCVAMLVGCGSVNNNQTPEPDAAVVVDAAPPRCDPSKRFGDETMIGGFGNAEYQQSISLLSDERTAYLAIASKPTSGEPDFDIYKATRPSDSGDFGTPTKVAFDTSAPEADVTVTGDGTLMVIRKPGANTYGDLYQSNIEPDGSFKTVTRLDISDPNTDEVYPTLAVDGSALYFSRFIDDNVIDSLFISLRNNGVFTPATEIPGVNTKDSENGAVMSPDRKQVYFARGEQMFFGIRTNVADNFAPTELLDADGQQIYGQATWMPTDGCRMYYSRSTYSQQGDILTTRLYVRSRPL